MLRGVRVINCALGLFEKILNKLRRGMEICKFEISKRDENIEIAKREKAELLDVMSKADRVIENIEKIIS